MNFDLDENQQLYKATVERFVANDDVPSRQGARRLAGGHDRARWAELAELGLIAVALTEADGGLGGGDTDCAVVAQALGRGVVIEPWLECGYLPARLGGDLPGLADGSTHYAFAFAEAGGRYTLDARSMVVRHQVLNGRKQFVLGGEAADRFIVTANDGGATQLFVVEREAADCRSYPVADGSVAVVMTLRDAPGVPLAGGVGRITSAVGDTMLMAAAEMVGLAQRLFDETLAYVKQREQFGQPIGRFQVIQHRMVDNYARVEEAQSALLRALLMPQPDRARQIAGLKAQIGAAAMAVAHDAVQFHGGMGTTDDLIIGHALKRVLLLSKLFGDTAQGFDAYAKAA